MMTLALSGCSLFQRDLQRSIDQKTDEAIDKVINEKVAKALETELPKAVSKGIGQWVFDTGPYGLLALLTILLGKKHFDLAQEKKKNGHKPVA